MELKLGARSRSRARRRFMVMWASILLCANWSRTASDPGRETPLRSFSRVSRKRAC